MRRDECVFTVKPSMWDARVEYDFPPLGVHYRSKREVSISGVLLSTEPLLQVDGIWLCEAEPLGVEIKISGPDEHHGLDIEDIEEVEGYVEYDRSDDVRAREMMLRCFVSAPKILVDELFTVVKVPGLLIRSVTITAGGTNLAAAAGVEVLASDEVMKACEWQPTVYDDRVRRFSLDFRGISYQLGHR